jgi:hypothetical protein
LHLNLQNPISKAEKWPDSGHNICMKLMGAPILAKALHPNENSFGSMELKIWNYCSAI